MPDRHDSLNWDDLRFLVEIGRHGSLAAAARQLRVDQTTVARRLRALEKRLGAPLFERHEGRWQASGVGAATLAQALRIEQDIASLMRTAEAQAQQVAGVVRITSVGAIVADYLVPRLPALYAQYPDLRVDLIASNDNLDVSRREADIAVRLARPDSGDFLIRKLGRCGFAVYGSAGSASATPPMAAPARWVAYHDALDHTPEMRWLMRHLAQDGGTDAAADAEASDDTATATGARIRLRSDSLRGLLQAVASGLGQGILPCFLADAHPDLIRLSGAEPLLTRDLWLLTHRDAHRQARVQAASRWLVACFAADAIAFQGYSSETNIFEACPQSGRIVETDQTSPG